MAKLLCTLSLVAMLLAACSPATSRHDAMRRLNEAYSGHDVSEFFLSYGAANNFKSLEDGEKLYRWISIAPPGEPAGEPYLVSPRGHYAITHDASNGEMISGYCQVAIRTDDRDRIRTITLLSDSTGKFSGSRCAEIFSPPGNAFPYGDFTLK